MISSGMEFFAKWSRLQPRAYVPNGTGTCPCGRNDVTLYCRGPRSFCLTGVLLKQVYPMTGGKADNRLQDSSYMLITERRTLYWGNFALDQHFPIQKSETDIFQVKRDLILRPPKPPWMFVTFSRSNDCRRLFVTTDSNTLWFSGETQFRRLTVDCVDRNHVLALHATGISLADWRRFVLARRNSIDGNPKALPILREIIDKHPALAELTIPPRRSPEAVVLESVLP